MLKLETASKLKSAGLKWEPQVGDFYLQEYLNRTNSIVGLRVSDNEGYYGNTVQIWLPRLDQLLTEIEKRMYQWELTSYSALPPVLDEEGYPRTYKIQLFDEEGQVYEIGDMANIFNPGESAAQALLWILEQEAIA